MLPGETQNERDSRIEHLWQKLDSQKKGKLDLAGLKKGLSKIDHREFGCKLACLLNLIPGSFEKRQ
jgi:hypothetical protein